MVAFPLMPAAGQSGHEPSLSRGICSLRSHIPCRLRRAKRPRTVSLPGDLLPAVAHPLPPAAGQSGHEPSLSRGICSLRSHIPCRLRRALQKETKKPLEQALRHLRSLLRREGDGNYHIAIFHNILLINQILAYYSSIHFILFYIILYCLLKNGRFFGRLYIFAQKRKWGYYEQISRFPKQEKTAEPLLLSGPLTMGGQTFIVDIASSQANGIQTNRELNKECM